MNQVTKTRRINSGLKTELGAGHCHLAYIKGFYMNTCNGAKRGRVRTESNAGQCGFLTFTDYVGLDTDILITF